MKILIDADYIVYKSCAAAESEVDFGDDVILVTSNFNDAYNAAKREIAKIEKKLGDFSNTILFFSDSVNFRKKFYQNIKDIEIVKNHVDTNVSSMLLEKSTRSSRSLH